MAQNIRLVLSEHSNLPTLLACLILAVAVAFLVVLTVWILLAQWWLRRVVRIVLIVFRMSLSFSIALEKTFRSGITFCPWTHLDTAAVISSSCTLLYFVRIVQWQLPDGSKDSLELQTASARKSFSCVQAACANNSLSNATKELYWAKFFSDVADPPLIPTCTKDHRLQLTFHSSRLTIHHGEHAASDFFSRIATVHWLLKPLFSGRNMTLLSALPDLQTEHFPYSVLKASLQCVRIR